MSRASRGLRGLALAVLTGATSTLMVVAPGGVPAAQAATPDGAVRWLAAGDSYSSGEGIPGTGYPATPKVPYRIPANPDQGRLCARSPLAFAPKAADILRTQRGWDIPAIAFPACTGATTDAFYSGQGIAHAAGVAELPPQWAQALKSNPPGRFDVVSFSFGGNDVGFAEIIEGCLNYLKTSDSWSGNVGAGPVDCDYDFDGSDETGTSLKPRVDELIKGNPTADGAGNFGEGNAHLSLPAFYADVVDRRLTPGGVLVVVGYPRIFADVGNWAPWRGNRCNFASRQDAGVLQEASDYLNEKLREAVATANDMLGAERVQFVDRAGLFAGHELCSDSVEYMNGVTLGLTDGSSRYLHSFHPNEVGHQVTAEAVAGYVESFLRPEAAAPPTTTPPPPPAPVASAPASTAPPSRPTPTPTPAPIGDGTSHFNIGDPFDTTCVVAWPTAPTYTNSAIIMTMDCRGTPEQFLLTQVHYPDPDLPINPSTGQVRVTGQVADYAQSAYGYRLLVVEADSVTW